MRPLRNPAYQNFTVPRNETGWYVAIVSGLRVDRTIKRDTLNIADYLTFRFVSTTTSQIALSLDNDWQALEGPFLSKHDARNCLHTTWGNFISFAVAEEPFVWDTLPSRGTAWYRLTEWNADYKQHGDKMPALNRSKQKPNKKALSK